MSDLIPPPRMHTEVAITAAFAVAFGIYTLPIVLAAPEDETLELPYADTTCCFCHRGELGELDDDEPYDPDSGIGRLMYVDRYGPIPMQRQPEEWSPPPGVPGRPFVSQGTLARGQLKLSFKRAARALDDCDDTRPSLSLDGREREVAFGANFLIDHGGHVTSIGVATDEPIGACVKRVVSQLRFPPSDGNTQVHLYLRYGSS